jgi:hypothetical protein
MANPISVSPVRPPVPQMKPKGTRYAYAYPLSFTSSGLGVLGANGGSQNGNIIGYPGQRWSFLNIGFASDYPFLLQLTLTRLGGALFNAPISSETLLGPLDRPGLLPYPIELEGSESIQVQLTNNAPNTTSTNTVYMTFWGFRDMLSC